MEQLIELLKAVGFDNSVIEQAKEGKVEDVAQVTQSLLDNKAEFFKKSVNEKKIGDKAIIGYKLRIIKDLNKSLSLGLGNAKMTEYGEGEISDFYKDVSTIVDDRVETSKNASNEELLGKIREWQEKATTATERAEALEEGRAAFEEETTKKLNDHIRLKDANDYFSNLVKEDETLPDIQGRDAILELLRKDIFNNHYVTGDGSVFDLDGKTKVTHPTKEQAVVNNVAELYEIGKQKLGLFKQSNAGKTPSILKVAGGGELRMESEEAKRTAEIIAEMRGE